MRDLVVEAVRARLEGIEEAPDKCGVEPRPPISVREARHLLTEYDRLRANALKSALDEIEFAEVVLEALDASLRLQSHYANLLNGYDGGKRRTFGSSREWIARLKEVERLRKHEGRRKPR